MTIDKVTTALIDTNATVDALAGGTATPFILTGAKSNDGSAVLRGNVAGVIVQSTSSEDITHFTVAVGAGSSVGVAGAVALTIIDSDTIARIGGGARINQVPGATPSANQSVYINASNTINAFAFAGALGVGSVGLAGAVNVGILRNDTLADVQTGAIVSARNDAAVNTLSIENIRGYTLGGAAGVVGLAASISVWSVGSALSKNYSDDNRSGSSAPQSANALEGSGGQRADSDAGRQAQGGRSQSGAYLNNFDKDNSNPNRCSTKSVGSIMGNAVNKVNAAAPTQASLQAEIDAGGVASGTTARISGGAKVEVGDAIFVTSDAGLKYLQFAGAIAGGYVGAGAGISVSTLANNSTASAGGILTSGNGGISVRSINNENAQGTGVAGAIGFVAIGAAVVIVNDASVAQSAVSDAAVVNTSGSVSITASDNRTMNTNTYSVSAGTIAIGASFSQINLKNDNAIETQAVIGNGASVVAASINLASTPIFTTTADTLGVAGGIIAGTVNFAVVDAQPESKAMIGSSTIVAGGEIAINSLAKYDMTAKGTGVAVGLGAVGLMYADVNLGRGDGIDEVTAGVGAARITSSKLNVRANSDDKLFAKSVAGSAALISVTGALAFTSSDQAARTTIGNDAVINTGTLGLYSTHTADMDSISDAITVAAASGQAGLTRNVNTGNSNVSVGNNASVNAIELYVNATNELVKNKADDAKPFGQQYRNNIDAQSFEIAGLDILTSNSNLGTSSNPLAANVSSASGSHVTAASLPYRSSVFDVSTSTRLMAHDFVNIESISLLGAISAGFSIIDAVTQSKITVDGATLVNEDGAVSLSTRSYADNSPDAKLLVVSGLFGIAAAKVRADTTATSQVDVNNATIKGQSVSILSGKYNSPSTVGINLLDSHAWSTVRTASLIPSGVFDSVQSTVRENNFVNITGSSKVLAIGDVDLVARSGFSTSKVDKQVSVISIIPSFSSDSIDGALLQNNLVNIANSAKVEAGLGSNVTYKIEPLLFNGTTPTIGGVLGPNAARIGQPLNSAEKISRALPTDIDFVFAPLGGGSISMPILNGYVFRLINGAASSGVIGGYYQYIGGDAAIVPHTTQYANTTLWRQLSQTEINALPGSEFVVYDSDITKNFAAGLTGKYYIIKPADSAQPILSLRNVGNLLIKQYDDIVSWMANHSGNSEAIARYQAQLLTLEAQLNDLGLLAPDKVNGRQIVNKGLDVLFVDLPSLTASPGSIYVVVSISVVMFAEAPSSSTQKTTSVSTRTVGIIWPIHVSIWTLTRWIMMPPERGRIFEHLSMPHLLPTEIRRWPRRSLAISRESYHKVDCRSQPAF